MRKKLSKLYYNKYNSLIDISSQWNTISPSEKRAYLMKYRNAINEVMEEIVKTARFYSSPEYFSVFNNLVKRFNSIAPFRVEPLGTPSDKYLAEQISNMASKLKIVGNDAVKVQQAKIDYYNSLKDAYNSDDLNKINRRITLLDVGGINARRAQNFIISRIRQGLDSGDDFDKVGKDVLKRLKSVFPDGKIPIKTKKGYRQMDIEDYADGWVFDMQSISSRESTLSYMSQSGCELVIVRGGLTDNQICDPYSNPSDNIFALTQEASLKYGYSIIPQFPPYHPWCSKYIQPYFVRQ